MSLHKFVDVVFLSLLLVPFIVANAQETPETKEADLRESDSKLEDIPKASIFTTSIEPGFKKRLLASADDDTVPYYKDLRAINKQTDGMGASNIFLVRGDDINQAVHGTRMVFTSGDSADKPASRDIRQQKVKSDKLWVVVYFGSRHSGPPYWRFTSVSLRNRLVEFRYRTDADPKISTGDGIQYFYWVPLPSSIKGTYELRLIDSDKGAATLVRFVDHR